MPPDTRMDLQEHAITTKSESGRQVKLINSLVVLIYPCRH